MNRKLNFEKCCFLPRRIMFVLILGSFWLSITEARTIASDYPDIRIVEDSSGTNVLCNNELLLELRRNRFLRFRATTENENWIGSKRSPADLGWVYRDQGAKGMEVTGIKYDNNPEKGSFVIWITGKKTQFQSEINIKLTANWMPHLKKFYYTLNTRLQSPLEDWYVNSKPQVVRGKMWTEVLDYCIEGISNPEILMARDENFRKQSPRYEWFIKSHDGEDWKKWPKTAIPYPVRKGDYITIRELSDPSTVGSYYGFVDMQHGGWLTKITKTPAPIIHEICWAFFDVHMNLEGAIPERGSAEELDLHFEMQFLPVEPIKGREIVNSATELPWRLAPEYDLPLFSFNNRFEKNLIDIPSEEAGNHMFWWPSDYYCYRDSTMGYDDTYSLSIKRPTGVTKYSAYSTASWKFPYSEYRKTGTQMRLTAKVKTRDCTGSVRLAHYASIGDAFYRGTPDADRKTGLLKYDYSESLTATNDWTDLSLDFTLPQGQSTVLLEFTGAGQVWFDNVTIERIDNIDRLTNGLGEKNSDAMILEEILIDTVWAANYAEYSIRTVGTKQYVAYFNRDRLLTVAYRDIGSKHWEKKVLPDTLRWDSHNSVSLGIDGSGYIHVSGNMHVDPLAYYRSKKPYDVNTIQAIHKMVGQDEERVTYPRFFYNGKKELLFSYRAGTCGDGNILINRFVPPKNKWERYLNTPLFEGIEEDNDRAAYHKFIKDDFGNYHFLWIWRWTPMVETTHQLCYAVTNDFVHWKNARGEEVRLPFRPDDEKLIVDGTPSKGGMHNSRMDIIMTPENSPLIGYIKYDENGLTQFYLTHFKNGTWHSQKISNWDFRWTFMGGGDKMTKGGNFKFDGFSEDGTLIISWSTEKRESGKYYINPKTLSHVHQKVEPVFRYPEAMYKKISDDPLLTVRISHDKEARRNEKNEYILKWETMPGNWTDVPEIIPEGPLSELRVLKISKN